MNQDGQVGRDLRARRERENGEEPALGGLPRRSLAKGGAIALPGRGNGSWEASKSSEGD
jgi:hypothetical protein